MAMGHKRAGVFAVKVRVSIEPVELGWVAELACRRISIEDLFDLRGGPLAGAHRQTYICCHVLLTCALLFLTASRVAKVSVSIWAIFVCILFGLACLICASLRPGCGCILNNYIRCNCMPVGRSTLIWWWVAPLAFWEIRRRVDYSAIVQVHSGRMARRSCIL